eukprot:3058549-Amphidinium_carterae.1
MSGLTYASKSAMLDEPKSRVKRSLCEVEVPPSHPGYNGQRLSLMVRCLPSVPASSPQRERQLSDSPKSF